MVTLLSANAWVKIKTNGKVIHIDPGFMGTFKTFGRSKEVFEEPADLILITHEHSDHLQPSIVKKITKADTIIFAPTVCETLLKGAFRSCQAGDSHAISPFTIQVVHSYNTPQGHSTQKNHQKGVGVGYIIKTSEHTFYHAGDTDYIPEMEDFPEIDVAFLPIGGTYTMDISEAVKTSFVLQAGTVIPMHFLKADPMDFKKQLEAQSSTRVIVLKPGQETDLQEDSE